MRKQTWLLLLVFPLLLGFAGKGKVLKHDDGKQDSKQSIAGTAQAVRFERPSEKYVVTEVQIYGEQ